MRCEDRVDVRVEHGERADAIRRKKAWAIRVRFVEVDCDVECIADDLAGREVVDDGKSVERCAVSVPSVGWGAK